MSKKLFTVNVFGIGSFRVVIYPMLSVVVAGQQTDCYADH
jgi:hypothetical protein